jgi:hypothetical protein
MAVSGSGDSVGPNPNETFADLSSPLNDIDDIMEWQEILNSVAKEKAAVRDEDVALLGNCDSEDKEDLDGLFVASHAERRLHLQDNEAVHDMEDAVWMTMLPMTTSIDHLDKHATMITVALDDPTNS